MPRTLLFVAGLLVACVMGAVPHAAADGKTGIVVMHGKDGSAKPGSPIGGLVNYLGDDFLVEAPNMPWSRRNALNRTLEESFAEIDQAVARLKSLGADKIVVGGHSMGAAAALAYATERSGLAGVVLMAPGHRPDVWSGKNRHFLSNARELVAAGKSKETVDIYDKNQGKLFTRRVAAEVAVSWFDPDGLAVMQNAAAKLPEGTPVLIIIGEDDGFRPKVEGEVFDKLPAHPKNAFLVIGGGHKQTPEKGKSEIAAWLNGL